ncbi:MULTISPECIES: META domain-containing protein [Bacteroidota]|uniref:META domain n=2 Tax=Bacteroidota TaxID=976 RepID=A0A2X2JSQ2_SPHMU|nr:MULTISPECIES: META domain-containing protein [Bacteroidota]AZB25086.1 META domain-containing protein [Chryseobacterium bernardetii]QRQ63176.1 META domain-containing protein [Sphingobacterium multivorum]SPZ94961.1 META domain [Sphingobacterium multivorum]
MKKALIILSLGILVIGCNNGQKSTSAKNDSVSQPEEVAQTPDLFGKEWKLIELNNAPIKIDTAFKKEPMITFNKDNNQLNGNGGCNGFGGSFKTEGNDGIEISLTGATMMSCPNLEVETKFLDILKQSKHYSLSGNTLELKDKDQKITAKLEVK